LDPREVHHGASWEALNAAAPPRILSPFVLAELDYLIARNLGHEAEYAFLEDVSRGVYELARFTASDVDVALAIIRRYGDLAVGLADASIVVLAGKYAT